MFWTKVKPFLPYLKKYRREVLIGITALLLTDIVGLAIPWLLKLFVDLLPSGPTGGELVQYALLLFLAASFQAVGRFGWRKYLFGPSRKIECDILNQLFNHLLTLDRSFFQKMKTGDLMSRATNDLRAVRDFLGLGLLILIDAVVVIVCAIFLMLLINPVLTLWVMLPLPLVSIIFFKFVKEISLRHRAVQEHLSRITEHVQENLAGIRVLHAFVQEENEKRKFDVLNREYIRKNLRVTKLFGIFTPSLVFTIGVAGMISLWIGGKAVIAGEMTLGSFVAFNGYLMMLSWPMMGIGYVFNITQRGLTAMGRLLEIFNAVPSIVDRPETREGGIPEGRIEFQNLSFSYPGVKEPNLEQIDLEIPGGHQLAVIGKIGSGKTTLIQMLARFYEARTGVVLIDGRPVQELSLTQLRAGIGFVDQEPFLFSASIRDNIALGREEAGEEEIEEAVRCSGLAADLDRFPEGLETIIGERGVSLSGGQKQRIALARALVRKPKILVLDDAFSSLDAETEETVLKNIKETIQGITTIIITHRLSVVRDVEQIIVMEGGRIMERGTHEELLKAEGIYARTYRDQKLAMDMEITLQ